MSHDPRRVVPGFDDDLQGFDRNLRSFTGYFAAVLNPPPLRPEWATVPMVPTPGGTPRWLTTPPIEMRLEWDPALDRVAEMYASTIPDLARRRFVNKATLKLEREVLAIADQLGHSNNMQLDLQTLDEKLKKLRRKFGNSSLQRADGRRSQPKE